MAEALIAWLPLIAILGVFLGLGIYQMRKHQGHVDQAPTSTTSSWRSTAK
jgi:hypothetical protein